VLGEFASRNKESIAELLAEFFRYYAWLFDYRHFVVSLQNGAAVLKAKKAEADGWPQHERLSIEDPFETWYDVAHVIKPPQMAYIRKEFLRAHTLLSPTSLAQIGPDKVLDVLCDATSEPPPFSAVAKEKERALRADDEFRERGLSSLVDDDN
jgi:DNA polymerase sigma